MEQSNEKETNSNEILPEELSDFERKELIWEENHEKIATVIRYLQRKEMDITVTNIAKGTNLSRKTVYKHLSQDDLKFTYKTATYVNKFLMDDVIGRMRRMACNGNIAAAKIYLELMGAIKPANNTINANLINNNKAIMVNGHVLSDEMVQKLSPENLSQLEEFVKAAEISNGKSGLHDTPKITE